MSYTSILNDGFNMKRNMDNQSLISCPELKQGQALLRRRSKMKKSVRVRSKELMKESFTNMTGSTFQQAVVNQNDKEIQELIGMQKSYDKTMQSWQRQKDKVITEIKNKPKEYQDCVEHCRATKAGDALNACLYGCGIGKFASASTTYRGNKPPPPPPLPFWDVFLDAMEVLAAVAAAVAIGLAFASGVGEAGLGFGGLAGGAFSSLGAGFGFGAGAAAGFGIGGIGALGAGALGVGLSADAAAAAALALYAGVYGALIYEALKNAPPGEPPAKTIMNATIKRLGTLKKPETVGDVIAMMALIKFTKGGESGPEALQSAVDNLNNSKYAKYSGADLNAAELETFKLGKMNALEYYEKLIGKFGFTTPFDDLNQVVKYYYLLFLAQTKQGVEHLATTTPPPGVGNGKLSQYKSGTKEGFENNLQKYSVGSVTSDGQVITNRGDFLGITTDPAQMGSYGPVGWGKNRVDSKQKAPKGAGEEIVNDADLKTRKAINNLLGSDPVASTVRTGTWGQTKAQSKDKAQTLDQMISVNPDGVRTLLASTTNIFKSLHDELGTNPLVMQMINADSSPETIDGNLKKLEQQWAKIFKTGCAMGIADPNYKPGSNVTASKSFAGHKQYCKSFTNTKQGRSGFYGQNYVVGKDGKIGLLDDNSLIGTTIDLNNQRNIGTADDKKNGRYGCDIEIKPDQSGYCNCIDGTKIYMDGGHPSVSCNDLCYPKNIIESGNKQSFFHNSNAWVPGLKPKPRPNKGVKAFNQWNDPGNGDTPWLQCGEDGGEPDNCPNGMVQFGDVTPNKASCKTYNADPWFEFWTSKEEPNLGRKCVLPLPPGGEFPKTALKTVGNGLGLQIPKGYTKLPSPSELVDECKNVPYANLYIDILKFMVLNKVMSFKTKVMGDIVTKTNTEINKTKLEQSAVGRKLLRDMQKYKKTYDAFQRNSQRKNQLAGMYEDINFKSQSVNISYYIWFILAISGMFLVIKKLKSSN
jgi:hypothetical protein